MAGWLTTTTVVTTILSFVAAVAADPPECYPVTPGREVSASFSEEGTKMSTMQHFAVRAVSCFGKHCDNKKLRYDLRIETVPFSGSTGHKWSPWISEENDNRRTSRWECPVGTVVTLWQCDGKYCDSTKLGCSTPLYWDVNPRVSKDTSRFSEEGSGMGACPENHVLTGLDCAGDFCDNLVLICRPVSFKPRLTAHFERCETCSNDGGCSHCKEGHVLSNTGDVLGHPINTCVETVAPTPAPNPAPTPYPSEPPEVAMPCSAGAEIAETLHLGAFFGYGDGTVGGYGGGVSTGSCKACANQCFSLEHCSAYVCGAHNGTDAACFLYDDPNPNHAARSTLDFCSFQGREKPTPIPTQAPTMVPTMLVTLPPQRRNATRFLAQWKLVTSGVEVDRTLSVTVKTSDTAEQVEGFEKGLEAATQRDRHLSVGVAVGGHSKYTDATGTATTYEESVQQGKKDQSSLKVATGITASAEGKFFGLGTKVESSVETEYGAESIRTSDSKFTDSEHRTTSLVEERGTTKAETRDSAYALRRKLSQNLQQQSQYTLSQMSSTEFTETVHFRVPCGGDDTGINTYQWHITGYDLVTGETVLSIPTDNFRCLHSHEMAPKCPPEACGDLSCSCCRSRDWVPAWFEGIDMCDCLNDQDSTIAERYGRLLAPPVQHCSAAAARGWCDAETFTEADKTMLFGGFAKMAKEVRQLCPCNCQKMGLSLPPASMPTTAPTAAPTGNDDVSSNSTIDELIDDNIISGNGGSGNGIRDNSSASEESETSEDLAAHSESASVIAIIASAAGVGLLLFALTIFVVVRRRASAQLATGSRSSARADIELGRHRNRRLPKDLDRMHENLSYIDSLEVPRRGTSVHGNDGETAVYCEPRECE